MFCWQIDTAPMAFTQEDISNILSVDFEKDQNFVDDECAETCYIYPICPTCSGANYLKNKSFKTRDKSHCKFQKLAALFTADLQAKQIVKNPNAFDEETLYFKIEAIKKIKAAYYNEFEKHLS